MSSLPPSVCLDSVAVRRIREEKKLTQLYVSKVVGVTPDTISRWENNRYPTVKRENALRLAEALEVEVDALLQRQEDEAGPAERSGAPSFFNRPVGRWLVLLLLLFGAGGLWFFFRPPKLTSSLLAERWLPRYAAPGGLLPVRIHLEADTERKGFILRERFPLGWKIVEASPSPTSLDNVEGMARWIVKPESSLGSIAYLLQVGAAADLGAVAVFSGEVVVGADEQSQPLAVKGQTQVETAPFHWADLNGDSQVDDGEMLSGSEDFTAMPGIPLDWDALEKIWDAGSYRWDRPAESFVPIKKMPGSVADPASASAGR